MLAYVPQMVQEAPVWSAQQMRQLHHSAYGTKVSLNGASGAAMLSAAASGVLTCSWGGSNKGRVMQLDAGMRHLHRLPRQLMN